VPPALRALRGATTVDEDTTEQIEERVIALLAEMFERNRLHHDDLVSVLFTATDDIHALFPAAAARKFGLGDVPLICARELDIVGGTPLCIRVMMHLTTELGRDELRHVYLEGAKTLRDDLPE
jgi:chorismate mutase